MAFEIDGPNREIRLTAGTVVMSVPALYSVWVDWVALSDNAKYLPAFRTVGGDDVDLTAGTKVPAYCYLINGWRVRPQEATHTLNVTGGILLVDGGGDPFLDTLGNFIVRVNYSQPVQAITVATGGGGSAPTVVEIREEMDTNSTKLTSILEDTAEIGVPGAGLTNITVGTVTNLTNERGKYANGAVWIGPAVNTNTVNYVDGIITNPVSTIAAAKTIADSLKLRRFYTIRTGTVQIGQTVAGYDFDGNNWSVTTTGGARDVGTSHFVDANVVAGTFASTTGTITFESCEFGSGVVVGVSNLISCRFAGTLTLSTAGSYDFIDCASVVAGGGTPIFVIPSGVVALSFRRWSGGIQIDGITANTTVSIDVVSGGTVTLNGADGTVHVRGMVAGITDNRTGTPVLIQNAMLNQTVLAAPTVGQIWTYAIENALTAEQVLRIILAVAAGPSDIVDLGAGAATVKFRDVANTKDRVTATMANSERTSIVFNAD